MTQEEKELLLKDLCGRLSYRVIVHHPDYDEPECLDTIFTPDAWNEGGIMCTVDDSWDSPRDIICCKPYLRSMSSMTKEERQEYNEYLFHGASIGLMSNTATAYELIDWLNAHHFDYRGLIEKGLALEALEGMYK